MDEQQSDQEPNQSTDEELREPSLEPQIQTNQPIKKNKNTKKIVVIVLVILLILFGAIAYLLLNSGSEKGSNKSNNENTENTQTDSVFLPKYFIQTGLKVEYIGENGELETFTDIEDNEIVTDVRTIDDETRVYYYTTKPDDLFEKVISGYGYAVGNEKKLVATINETGPTYFSEPLLSPDASKFVMEGGYEGSGAMGDIYVYDTANGEEKLAYDTITEGEDRDLFIIVGWLDNSTVIVQEQTCRECDGPTKPVLNKLNIDTGSLTPFFNNDDAISTLQWAQVIIDDGKIYIFGGDYGKVFGGENVEYSPDELYEIDASTGESRLITTFSEDIVILGNVEDGKLYITLRDLVPTDSENAPYQSIDGNFDYSDSQLIEVNLSDGTKKQIALESKFFTNQSVANGVYNTSDGRIIVTSTSFNEVVEGVNEYGDIFAVLKLPEGTDSVELDLIKEHTTIYDGNTQPLRFRVAQ